MALETKCVPCEEAEVFVPKVLPKEICPVEIKIEPPNLLRTERTETIVTDCLFAALQAMATRFHCDLNNGPKGCG